MSSNMAVIPEDLLALAGLRLSLFVRHPVGLALQLASQLALWQFKQLDQLLSECDPLPAQPCSDRTSDYFCLADLDSSAGTCSSA